MRALEDAHLVGLAEHLEVLFELEIGEHRQEVGLFVVEVSELAVSQGGTRRGEVAKASGSRARLLAQDAVEAVEKVRSFRPLRGRVGRWLRP